MLDVTLDSTAFLGFGVALASINSGYTFSHAYLVSSAGGLKANTMKIKHSTASPNPKIKFPLTPGIGRCVIFTNAPKITTAAPIE